MQLFSVVLKKAGTSAFAALNRTILNSKKQQMLPKAVIIKSKSLPADVIK